MFLWFVGQRKWHCEINRYTVSHCVPEISPFFPWRKYEQMFQLKSSPNRTKHAYFTGITEIKDLFKGIIRLISHRLPFIWISSLHSSFHTPL